VFYLGKFELVFMHIYTIKYPKQPAFFVFYLRNSLIFKVGQTLKLLINYEFDIIISNLN
jgi:hypothetical protein